MVGNVLPRNVTKCPENLPRCPDHGRTFMRRLGCHQG
jgi:hypothetical protein